MTASEEASAALVDEILSGGNPQLSRLAATGMVPLPPSDLIPVQVALTRTGEGEVAELAASSLEELDPKLVARALAEETDAEVLAYFAQHHEHPLVQDAILRRSDVPRQLLVELAPRLRYEQQETLIDRQDAIVEEPGILEALKDNPDLAPYARRRIAEYGEYLLRKEEPMPGVAEGQAEDAVADPEVQSFLEEAQHEPEEGEIEELTGLTEGQIRTLPPWLRLRLSRGAPPGLRWILVRDRSPIIAVSVVRNNSLGDTEVEQICSTRTVLEDVLVELGNDRYWSRKYPVVHALVRNPRTPIPLALRHVPRLSIRDLRALARNRGVSDTVRQRARQILHAKER